MVAAMKAGNQDKFNALALELAVRQEEELAYLRDSWD